MTDDLHYLAYSAVLAFLMLITASFLRARMWTPKGFSLALGNRDDMPESAPIAGRADRAAKNMLENLLLFTVVVLVARLAGTAPEKIAVGAAVFFWARVAFFFIYVAGIPYLRTAAWGAGVAGLILILLAAHG